MNYVPEDLAKTYHLRNHHHHHQKVFGVNPHTSHKSEDQIRHEKTGRVRAEHY